MLETFNDFFKRGLAICEIRRLQQDKELVWVQIKHLQLLEVFRSVRHIKHDAELVESVQVGIFLGLHILHPH